MKITRSLGSTLALLVIVPLVVWLLEFMSTDPRSPLRKSVPHFRIYFTESWNHLDTLKVAHVFDSELGKVADVPYDATLTHQYQVDNARAVNKRLFTNFWDNDIPFHFCNDLSPLIPSPTSPSRTPIEGFIEDCYKQDGLLAIILYISPWLKEDSSAPGFQTYMNRRGALLVHYAQEDTVVLVDSISIVEGSDSLNSVSLSGTFARDGRQLYYRRQNQARAYDLRMHQRVDIPGLRKLLVPLNDDRLLGISTNGKQLCLLDSALLVESSMDIPRDNVDCMARVTDKLYIVSFPVHRNGFEKFADTDICLCNFATNTCKLLISAPLSKILEVSVAP